MEQNYDEYGNIIPVEQPNPLRGVVHDLEKQKKELEKQLKEMQDQHAEAAAKVRTSVVADILAQNKIKPSIAKFIPSSVDATPEAVAEWLKAEGDAFGIEPTVFEPPSPEDEKDSVTLRQFGRTTDTGRQPDKTGEVSAKLEDPNLTYEELLRMTGNVPSGRRR